MPRYTCRVVPWRSRVTAVAPLAIVGTGLVLFVTGMASHDVRTDPTLRPVIWGALVVALAALPIALLVRRLFAQRVIVDDAGVRVVGRSTIDLGRPRATRHGQFHELVVYGRGALKRRNTPFAWVAVEASDGRVAVFMRALGIQHAIPDWPAGRPPRTPDVFHLAGAHPAAFRTGVRQAIGDATRAAAAP